MAGDTVIHPLAIVEPGATLGAGVKIGPFCHVGADATLGDKVELVSHVSIMGATTIGAGCKVYPQAVLGAPPQNTKHKGGRTTLVIGRNCTIREGVTMHLGTDTSRGETTVGDNGYFLAYTHVAHDCVVGNNVTMANLATLAGHVVVGDYVGFGGFSAAHQNVRIGHHAFIGGLSAAFEDVIPYGMVRGTIGALRGLNLIGMKRSGMPRSEIHAVRNAFKAIFDRSHTMDENMSEAERAFADSPAVQDVLTFMRSAGHRSFATPWRGAKDQSDDNGED
nr:acyl-ACP--UDP-N-acetylglucosamine O-acyltransferase [Mesorhizobium sp.]